MIGSVEQDEGGVVVVPEQFIGPMDLIQLVEIGELVAIDQHTLLRPPAVAIEFSGEYQAVPWSDRDQVNRGASCQGAGTVVIGAGVIEIKVVTDVELSFWKLQITPIPRIVFLFGVGLDGEIDAFPETADPKR